MDLPFFGKSSAAAVLGAGVGAAAGEGDEGCCGEGGGDA